ncbi:MAG TPA: DUF6538 domain-containing protein, partial [Acetobacteraceae bacterium]|nr:DUF6538 domain-containing protein [Acetobacteraceae bacterium]
MQNLLRRGNTWFARLFIPHDRWADVGKALKVKGGLKREVVRTLGTTDRAEAKRRLTLALAQMQREIDVTLKNAGRKPLTDWTAEWPKRAVELRAAVQAADDTPRHNAQYDH